jgi:hypothetical protein
VRYEEEQQLQQLNRLQHKSQLDMPMVVEGVLQQTRDDDEEMTMNNKKTTVMEEM